MSKISSNEVMRELLMLLCESYLDGTESPHYDDRTEIVRTQVMELHGRVSNMYGVAVIQGLHLSGADLDAWHDRHPNSTIKKVS